MRGVLGACLFAGLAASAAAAPPREIHVVTDINYPPYLFKGEDGTLQGILKDKWALWSQRTGVPARVEGMEWIKAQESVQKGTADVIEALSYTEARALLYEYSPPYAPVEARVFFRRTISGIKDVASMRGFAVGAKEGSACGIWLAERGIDAIRPYPDSEALIKAAGGGEIRLFCMDSPAAHYYLFKSGLADEFRETPPLYETQFHWAVRKGQVELRDFIQAGFARIPEKELGDIDAHWLGTPLRYQLSDQQARYLTIAAIALLGFVLLFLVWNRALQTRVHRALGSLRESEQRMGKLVEASPELIAVVDMADNRFVQVNPACEALLGYSSAEMVGRTALELNLWVDLEQRRHYLDDLVRNGVVQGREAQLRRRNGELRQMLFSAALLALESRRFILFQAVDITEQRRSQRLLEESEQRISKLFEASPEMIAVADLADSRFVQVNPACEKVLGYTSAEMVGRTGAELGLWLDLEARARYLDEVGRAGVVHGQEIRVRRKDGGVRDILSSAAVFSLEERRFILFQGIDITEQKAAQQALRELAAHHDSVREGERAHIAREVHDELGQALTALKMDLSLLNMKLGESEPRIREPVQGLKERVDTIIQAVRDVATALRPAALDLGFRAGVEWLVGEFRKRSGIACTLSGTEGDFALGEERSIVLFRILQESLTNIARHAGARNVAITLERDAAGVRLRIEDDGVGFDVGAAAGRKTFGLLGMKERAIMLKGEMSITSVPGRGTRISVSMPTPS
jgi:PAS domain S-box-containing protein